MQSLFLPLCLLLLPALEFPHLSGTFQHYHFMRIFFANLPIPRFVALISSPVQDPPKKFPVDLFFTALCHGFPGFSPVGKISLPCPVQADMYWEIQKNYLCSRLHPSLITGAAIIPIHYPAFVRIHKSGYNLFFFCIVPFLPARQPMHTV